MRPVLIFIFTLFSLILSAQQWTWEKPFCGVERMVETRDRVYFESAGALFAYDKEQDETLIFDKSNYLNDTGVNGLYAPTAQNWVVVTYANSNIDLLFDNGKVINLPDIKDSQYSNVSINSISFDLLSNQMLVTTSFGVVIYDLKKYEVKEAGIFEQEVKLGTFASSTPFIVVNSHLYALPRNASPRRLENWIDLGYHNFSSLLGDNNKLYGVRSNYGEFHTWMLTTDGSSIIRETMLDEEPAKTLIAGNKDVPVYIRYENRIDGFDNSDSPFPSETFSIVDIPYLLTVSDSPQMAWIGNDKGIQPIDFTNSGRPIWNEPLKPGNLPVSDVKIMRMTPSGNVLISNRGNSNVFYDHSTRNVARQAKREFNGSYVNLTPKNLTVTSPINPNPDGFLFDPTFISESPSNPNVFFTGNITEGFYALSADNVEEIIHFTDSNSPLTDNYGLRAMDVEFDSFGNLWMISERQEGLPALFRLPAHAMAGGLQNVTKDQWEIIEDSKIFSTGRDGAITVSSTGRYLYCMGAFEIFVYDTNSTSQLNDDVSGLVTRLALNDGFGDIEIPRISALIEDPFDKSLWIATSRGVFVAPEPWNVSNGAISAFRPKVPRNDGTNLADYLLETETIYDIAVDPIGQKWFVTKDSGVFLTNSDGSQIIENHNASNSLLPYNTVYSVLCDPTGNGNVFFGTPMGIVTYQSTTTAPSTSFDNVKIYPNPVRPSYQGPVTITGLMDGSIVKILGVSGNLVAQFQSEGGTVTWDANSASGSRLPSGVYHVIASSSSDSGKPVGKIVILR